MSGSHVMQRVSVSFSIVAILVLAFSSLSAKANEVLLKTDFGAVKLQITPEGKVTGQYPDYRGKLVGQVQPDGSFAMLWLQQTSEVKCTYLRNGTSYWGTATFHPDGDSFTGEWAYCNRTPGSGGQWNGRVVSGAFMSKTKALDVSREQQYQAIRFEWGQAAARARNYQTLSLDFTCDGAEDRIVSTIGLDNPDGPFFQILAITNHTGEAIAESRFFSLSGDGGPKSFCSAPDMPMPLVTQGPLFERDEHYNMIGYDTDCTQSFVMDDGMCDRKWGFWSVQAIEGSHFQFFQN